MSRPKRLSWITDKSQMTIRLNVRDHCRGEITTRPRIAPETFDYKSDALPIYNKADLFGFHCSDNIYHAYLLLMSVKVKVCTLLVFTF